jgi:preprotein translocase subunit YajC
VDVLLPFVLILVAFYLLILRPQRIRARQATQLRSQLAPGAEVLMTSGVYGTVTEVGDGFVQVEVAPGVTMKFATAAVGRILTEEAPDSADDDDTPEPDIDVIDAPTAESTPTHDDATHDDATHDDAGTGSRRPGQGE